MGIDLDSLKAITLERTGVVFNKDNIEGRRGTLEVGNVKLETIERGGNYVRLPAGKFLLTMTNDSSRGQVLIVYHEGKYGHNVISEDGDPAGIMIHSAQTPSQLKGCLAPGRSFDSSTNTLNKSTEAISDIMTFFGGFGETKLAGWIVVK